MSEEVPVLRTHGGQDGQVSWEYRVVQKRHNLGLLQLRCTSQRQLKKAISISYYCKGSDWWYVVQGLQLEPLRECNSVSILHEAARALQRIAL